MVKEIDVTLSDIIDEFTETNKLLDSNKNLVRIRLLIDFSLLEVLCVVFNQYYNLKLGDRALLKKFIKEYCLTNKNTVYNEHPYLNKIDEDYLYELRCSIIHAFALPEQKGNLAVTFPNGSENAPIIKKIEEGFKAKGINAVFISTGSLIKLFIKGGMILIEEMLPAVDKPTEAQFESVQRVYKEILRRGSKPVPLE
jgi:hypothetical protein